MGRPSIDAVRVAPAGLLRGRAPPIPVLMAGNGSSGSGRPSGRLAMVGRGRGGGGGSRPH
eukprot:COSAG01_NODE_26594_length_708_cov_12.251232_1_plen_59_part_10